MPFSELGLGDSINKAIQEAGYTEPTPIQAAAIPQILAGHDLIGIAQTGTGKTAAFTLPILAKIAEGFGGVNKPGSRVLVLAPTRELVVQIHENVVAYSKHVPITIANVYGGVSERPQIQALRSGANIVIATPGRLMDLMGGRHGNFQGLEFLVLDEADRMLDMGFIPSIRKILKYLPQKRQTLMFSATLSRDIEQLTHEFQRTPKTVQIGRRSNPAETVTQFVYEVGAHLKPALLAHLLNDPAMNMVLVFTRTKHGADRVARKLEQSKIATATLHSNRSQSQRLRALNDFKSGKVRVLVATDIAARGIDVDGISHVVNYDFPMHAEDYVHRIGRTGRAQAIGDALSFVTHGDAATLRTLERFIGRGIVRKRAEGFDYQASAPAREERTQDDRPRQQQQQRRGRPGDQRQDNRRDNRQDTRQDNRPDTRQAPRPADRPGMPPSSTGRGPQDRKQQQQPPQAGSWSGRRRR